MRMGTTAKRSKGKAREEKRQKGTTEEKELGQLGLPELKMRLLNDRRPAFKWTRDYQVKLVIQVSEYKLLTANSFKTRRD